MQLAAGLQFHYVIADPKAGEYHIETKDSECNSFQITTDLLNSESLTVAAPQLCHELQVHNFTLL